MSRFREELKVIPGTVRFIAALCYVVAGRPAPRS